MLVSQPILVIAGALVASFLYVNVDAADRFTIGSSLSAGKGGVSSSMGVDPGVPDKEEDNKGKPKAGAGPPRPQSATTSCPNHHAFPNGTRSHLAFYDCDRSLPLHVLFAKIVNSKTKVNVYPYDKDVEQDLILHVNNKGPAVNASKVNIHIYEWAANSSTITTTDPHHNKEDCDWSELQVPNRAKLENLDGCSLIEKCPLERRISILKVPLSQTFGQVIDQLEGGDIYQAVIRITEPEGHRQPLGCIVIQGLIKEEK